MSISTHILDTAIGRPAAGVPVALARCDASNRWTILSRMRTDADGRCRPLLPPSEPLTPGVYGIRFETEEYYAQHGIMGLYPYIDITFVVELGQSHYHLPLLLTANGYTTYRGS